MIVVASLAVFAYTVNLESPWESDQSAKAAQIMEIADANDYLLSDSLTRCYFLKLLLAVLLGFGAGLRLRRRADFSVHESVERRGGNY